MSTSTKSTLTPDTATTSGLPAIAEVETQVRTCILTRLPAISSDLPPQTSTITFDGEMLGSGADKVVLVGVQANGQKFAVAIYNDIEKKPCTDEKIQQMRSYKQQLDTEKELRLYEMPVEGLLSRKGKADHLCELSPVMRGDGTHYEGVEDGLDVFCKTVVSPTSPWKDPAKNYIRLIKNSFLGLLHLHQDAQKQGIHDFVYGDFKLEQLVVKTRKKEGIEKPYATLVLIDMPSQIPSCSHTEKYCIPVIDPSKRYHYEDLFALQVTLSSLLYQTLTRSLTENLEPLITTPDMVDLYFDTLWNTTERNDFDTIQALRQDIQEMPKSHPNQQVATYLIRCMYINQQGINQALAYKDDDANAQHLVIEVLKALEKQSARLLPNSGPTGSPSPSPVTVDSNSSSSLSEDISPSLSEDINSDGRFTPIKSQ